MIMRRTSLYGSAICAVSSVLGSSPAGAQTTPPASTLPSPTTDQAATDDQDIVITAEKRPTQRRDVPGAVSVLTAQSLADARINTLEQATRLVPGFEMGDSSGGQLSYPTIRGVSPQVFGDPTVAVLQDGFGFANSLKASSEEIFDASRIEVLKGPQATLYGANSLGGVINIISRLPSLTNFEGEFRASYGSYNSVVTKGAVSIPIINDVLAIRVGGYLDGRDGFWNNLFNGRKGQDTFSEKGARAAVLFRPSQAFESSLVYTYSFTHSDCSDCSNPILGYNPLNPTAVGAGTIDVNNLGRYTNENIPGYYRRRIHRVTWNNAIDLGRAKLTSLTSYGYLNFASDTDIDRGPGDTIFDDAIVKDRQYVFSQELRLASDNSGPLRWQVGAFYLDSIDHAITTIGLFEPPVEIPIGNARERFLNWAIFTQNAYEFSDKFELQIGLRYDHADKHDVNTATALDATTKSNAWLPKVSALYRLDANNNLYATVSRGYKTGGVNSGLPGTQPTYQPEYLWNYEAGFKGTSADHRIRYDLSAYYIDWTHQQVQQAAGIFTYINNAGKTHIYGVEGLLHYDVTPHFALDIAAAYNHARYVDYFDPTTTPIFFGVNPDRSGEPLFLSPDFSGSVAGHYVQPIGGGYDVTFGGDVRYTGKRALDTEAILKDDGFILANASVSVGDQNKRLTLFANNAFNSRYSTAAFLFTGLPPVTHLGAPRVVGLQADFKF